MNSALEMQSMTVPRRSRPFYARVAALGFGLIALTGLIGLMTALAVGDTGESLIFSVVFVIVGLLVALALWTSGTWARVLGIVLSLLLFALVVPFASFPLSHPESATEFVPIIIMIIGALLGLVGAVVALIQSRRGTPRDRATSAERTGLATLMGILAMAALFSVVLTLTSRTPITAEARVGAASMQIANFAFSPATWQAHPGDTVRMVIKNDDNSMHTFTLPAAGVDVAIPPGAEKIVEFKVPAAGIYLWYCIPHSAESDGIRNGMTGTLVAE